MAVSPNLTTLIGEHVNKKLIQYLNYFKVGAKLIAHSGGLSNLIKYPASTV